MMPSSSPMPIPMLGPATLVPPSNSAARDVWFTTVFLSETLVMFTLPPTSKLGQARKIGLGQVQFCQGVLSPQRQISRLVSPLKAPDSMLDSWLRPGSAPQIRQPAEGT